ncbi:MAG TPA: hypothetical protein VGB63_02700 [Pedobacter sp.]|jgi:hypothetical protein
MPQENLVYREDYNFKKDGRLEIIKSVIDFTTKEVKGYQSRQTGTFGFQSDSIIFRNMKHYWSGGFDPKRLDELTYSGTTLRMAYKPVYSGDRAQVTLLFNCPPFASCIPYPKLTRVK